MRFPSSSRCSSCSYRRHSVSPRAVTTTRTAAAAARARRPAAALRHRQHLLVPAAPGRLESADEGDGAGHRARAEAGRQQGRQHHRQVRVARRLHRAGRHVDAEATSANARKVAQDDKAVAYIGEFNSGASAISMPILNEAGVAAGLAREHRGRPDDERAGRRQGRAGQVLPGRRPAITSASSRRTPSRVPPSRRS